MLVLTALILVLALGRIGAAVGVRPLVIDMNLRPGDSAPFSLVLSPGETQEIVNLTLYKPTQLITGGLTYEQADAEGFPAQTWVELESNKVVVPPNESVEVAGMVRVPFDAGGAHTVVVMVEPEVEAAETGISFRVRYAVRINIVVDRPGLRPRMELADLTLKPDEQGNPKLSVLVRNTSPLHYPVTAEAVIRDENRRLVERVSLRPQASWRSNRESTQVYAGAEVLFYGDVNEPLFPGEYDLRLFVRYADNQQMLNQRVTIDEEDFSPHQKMALVKIVPQNVQAEIRPGGAASQTIQIDNRTGESMKVQLGGRDIEADYSHSIFQNLELQLRGAQEFVLDPRRSGRAVLTIRAPRDIQPGGYYGTLGVGVLLEDGTTDTYPIDVSVMVGEGWEHRAIVHNVHTYPEEAGHLITVLVENASPAHVEPTGTLYIKDGSGVILKTLNLDLQEVSRRILPKRSDLMVTTVDNLDPGTYTAEIKLRHGSKEIAVEEVVFTLGAEEESQ